MSLLPRASGRQGCGWEQGETRYRGHFGSRYMLCLDKNAYKNFGQPLKSEVMENKNPRVRYSRGMGFLYRDFTVLLLLLLVAASDCWCCCYCYGCGCRFCCCCSCCNCCSNGCSNFCSYASAYAPAYAYNYVPTPAPTPMPAYSQHAATRSPAAAAAASSPAMTNPTTATPGRYTHSLRSSHSWFSP